MTALLNEELKHKLCNFVDTVLRVTSGTALISGANRGLGLEFAKQLVERGFKVIATSRDPTAESLLALQKSKGADKLVIEQLDVSKEDSIKALGKKYKDVAIDLLLVNAGVLSRTRFGTLDAADLHKAFSVNAIGAVLFAQELYGCVKRAPDTGVKSIIAITSELGSISETTSNFALSYRMSKAALNMAFRCIAIESENNGDGVRALAIHPGWVKTDLGTAAATLDPPHVISSILDKIVFDADIKPLPKGFHHYDASKTFSY